MERAVLTIAGKEYELRFTIGFWKRMKELDVSPRNMETRLQEDFGTIAPKIILASVVGEEKPTLSEIEDGLDHSVMDVFEQAIINGMTKAEKEMLELAKKKRSDVIAGIEENLGKK